MRRYCIYALDQKGRVARPARIVSCESDDTAIRVARVTGDTGSTLEIWEEARFVTKVAL